jgi:arsenical pump membrane protein
VPDPLLARASLAAIGLLIVAVAAGAPVGLTSIAIGSALILLRPRLGRRHIDPRLVVAAVGVFCAAGVIASSLDTAGRLAGVDPLGLAALGALLGMAGTNLAATLLLNPAATTVPLRSGLLIGVNLGVGLTPVASLATILWGDSLRSRGVPVPWRGYLTVGVPLSVVFVLLAGFLS